MELILLFLLAALGGRREELRAEGIKLLEGAVRRDEEGRELLAAMEAVQRLAPVLRDPKGIASLLEGGLLAEAGRVSLFSAREAESAPAKEEGDGIAPVAFADDQIRERLRAYFAQGG